MRPSAFSAIAVCTVLVLSLAPIASAQIDSFVEDFSTTDFMDPLETTAWWDTGAGELKLHPFQISISGTADSPGFARDVVVAHTRAFVADGSGGLVIVDVTDPLLPTLLGAYDTAGDASAVALAGDHAFVADGAGGVVVVDISDLGAPVLAGTFATSGIALGIAVDGDHAFVAADTEGLLVLDISDPANPVLAGSFVPTGTASDVVVAGNHAFLAAGSAGLVIVDITEPTSPTLTGAYDADMVAEAIAVDGDLALLAAGESGLFLVDITDLDNPSLRGSFAASGDASDVAVDGDVVYLAAAGAGLTVVDITDPSLPFLVDALDTPGSAAGVTFAGEFAYVADDLAGLQVIETRTLGRLTTWGHHDTANAARDIEIVGDYAYLAVASDGLEVVDISDPVHPLTAGTFDLAGFDEAHDIAIAGDHAYLAYGQAHLVVVDISDPRLPVFAGGAKYPVFSAEAISVLVAGNHAYVVYSDGELVIYDVTDPAGPLPVGQYSGSQFTRDVEVAGDLAYLACGDDGLHVVDVSDPSLPTLAGSLSSPGSYHFRKLTLEGDVALAAGVYGGSFEFVFFLDITNPAAPVWNLGGTGGFEIVHDTVASGHVAFAAYVNQDGIFGGSYSMDLSDPTIVPLPVFGPTTQGPARAVALAGDHVFLAGDFGLDILLAYTRGYVSSQNVGQSLGIADGVAAVKLTTVQTDSIAWTVTEGVFGSGVTVTPGVWTPLFTEMDGVAWRSTHVLAPGGQNPTCSHLELEFMYSPATVDSIVDVPEDQGGWARIHFTRSGRDFGGSGGRITDYIVWRRVDETAMKSALEADGESVGPMHDLRLDYPDLPLVERDGRFFLPAGATNLEGFPPGTWEILGSFPALQQHEYIYLAPTQADSSAAGPAHSVHVVSAHANDQFWVSAPDSGYSLDNIAPSAPAGFQVDYDAGGNELTWAPSDADDFQYFNVYRAAVPEFTPGPDNLVHSLVETAWTDPDADSWSYHYLITALDHGGNESDAAAPGAVTAIDEPALPARLELYQNSPNPFNPRTTIRFDLPSPSRVDLRIYDVSGRHVRTLVGGELKAAGKHEVAWSGRDESGRLVAAGVYFYRFAADRFTQTNRMLLLK